MTNKKMFLGLALCLLSVIFWGSMFPVMTPALKIIDPFYFTLFRYGSVAIILAVLLFFIEGPKAFRAEGHLFKLWLLGTFAFAGFSFLVFFGQKMAGASGEIIASVMMAIQPLLGILVARVYRGIKPTRVAIFSMLAAVVGVFLVVTNGNPQALLSGSNTLLDVVIILLGALCWVIYTTGGADFKDWSILRFSALSTIYGMVSVVVILAIITGLGWLKIPTGGQVVQVLPELIYMVIPAGAIALFTWNMGNRIVTPINGILFMNLVPVTAFVISSLTGYKVGVYEMIGTVIVIAALVANNLYNRQMQNKKAKTERKENLQPATTK